MRMHRIWFTSTILCLFLVPISSSNTRSIKGKASGQDQRELDDLPQRKVPPTATKDAFKIPGRDWRAYTTKPSASASPSPEPISTPTSTPTSAPTSTPTSSPSSAPTKTPTFVPGKLTTIENGIYLSEGLRSRVIATSNQPVPLADGSLSSIPFHIEPDGAAVYEDLRKKGGWIYVSNSEVYDGEAGVGALYFDSNGDVEEYKVLMSKSTRNCSGGKTPWNTWVTCEEYSDGRVWQIDPLGRRPPEEMRIGAGGGNFESFAYDIRDLDKPRFFVTEDAGSGALRRFTPRNPNWNIPRTMLHRPGALEFLVLEPRKGKKDDDRGTYFWTTNEQLARDSASEFYRSSEGLDVYENELFFVSKTQKDLFILDLDGNTYRRTDTDFGLFDGQPDQMARLIRKGSSSSNEPESLLYFCEEGGSGNGVHARDANGWYYTILESRDIRGETSGLAFSPDGKHMYFSFQLAGLIYDVWREDGLPFYGRTLDVHYHGDLKSQRNRE